MTADASPDDAWRRFRATGDGRALGAVLDAVSPELFRLALSLAPDAASAKDALQETWLVALKSAERHDPARPVLPWLVGVLRRKGMEVRRAARRPGESRVAHRPTPIDPALAAESADDAARVRAERYRVTAWDRARRVEVERDPATELTVRLTPSST